MKFTFMSNGLSLERRGNRPGAGMIWAIVSVVIVIIVISIALILGTFSYVSTLVAQLETHQPERQPR